jgi:hypothetical protein
MGKSPFLMGKSHFLMGKSPCLMGKSHFLMGKSPCLMGKSPFFMGTSLFLWPFSIVFSMFTGGYPQIFIPVAGEVSGSATC